MGTVGRKTTKCDMVKFAKLQAAQNALTLHCKGQHLIADGTLTG